MRRYLIDPARGRPNAELVAMQGLENLLPADSAKADLAGGQHQAQQHSMNVAGCPPVIV
jgi:hypothetical protein